MRPITEVVCIFCLKTFNKPTKDVKYSNKVGYKTTFCSKECQGKYRCRSEDRECSFCGEINKKTFSAINKSKTGHIFCNRSCATKFNNIFYHKSGKNHPHYKGGTYRKKVVLDKCSSCGWNKVPQILQVHHKDRNRKNNNIENLEVLCPNCHTEEHYLNKDGLYKDKRKNISA